jgi:hypothetical protein
MRNRTSSTALIATTVIVAVFGGVGGVSAAKAQAPAKPVSTLAARANSQKAVAETVARIQTILAEQANKSAKAAPGKSTQGRAVPLSQRQRATKAAALTPLAPEQPLVPEGVRLSWNIPPVPDGVRLVWEEEVPPSAPPAAAPVDLGVRLTWQKKAP